MITRIKMLPLLLLGISLQAQTPQANNTQFYPTDPNIQYIGRVEASNPNRPTFTYPGVQIRTGFTGTSIAMMAKPQSGYFMVSIDEEEAHKVAFLTLAFGVAISIFALNVFRMVRAYNVRTDSKAVAVERVDSAMRHRLNR